MFSTAVIKNIWTVFSLWAIRWCLYINKIHKIKICYCNVSHLLIMFVYTADNFVKPAESVQQLLLFACRVILHAFVSSADFFNELYKTNLSGIPSECQTVWLQIRTDVLSGLIWVQTVCKGFNRRQKPPLAGKVLDDISSTILSAGRSHSVSELKFMQIVRPDTPHNLYNISIYTVELVWFEHL